MKAVALVLGVALLALGVAGFIPDLNPDGRLFGQIPMTTVYSILFVISGLVGIGIGLAGRRTMVPPNNSGGSGQDMRPWV
jgi:hypothetical protein